MFRYDYRSSSCAKLHGQESASQGMFDIIFLILPPCIICTNKAKDQAITNHEGHGALFSAQLVTTLFPLTSVKGSIEEDLYFYLVRLAANIRNKGALFFSNQMEQFFGEHYAAACEGMKRICEDLHADRRAVQIKNMNDAIDQSTPLPLEDCPQTLVEILATAIGMTSAEDLQVSKVLKNLP